MALPLNIFGIGKSPKSYLGVDIGTLSIKIVELSNENNRPKLENYAIFKNLRRGGFADVKKNVKRIGNSR